MNSQVSLYIYLHGKCPFMSGNLVAIFQMIRDDEPQFASTLSSNSRDLLEKMLDKNPQTRITIADIVAHPWYTSEL